MWYRVGYGRASRAGSTGRTLPNGAAQIALTFDDYLDSKNRAARRYDQLQRNTILFIEEVERVSGAPVTLIGTRFDPRSVIDRRLRYTPPA
jgi:adenylosuccinate synthase